MSAFCGRSFCLHRSVFATVFQFIFKSFRLLCMQFYFIHFSRFLLLLLLLLTSFGGCKCAIKETGYTPINLEMLATSSPSSQQNATTMLPLLLQQNVFVVFTCLNVDSIFVIV